jgi:hypothetical protein
MGTRAAFWIGDPRNLDNREWIGCKAWDGYPGNRDIDAILKTTTVEAFRDAIYVLSSTADDFAHPGGRWPYPWSDDVFLTDFTYAFFDGRAHVTHFHYGFVPASEILGNPDFQWAEKEDPSLRSVPAPSAYNPLQPDSILVMRGP